MVLQSDFYGSLFYTYSWVTRTLVCFGDKKGRCVCNDFLLFRPWQQLFSGSLYVSEGLATAHGERESGSGVGAAEEPYRGGRKLRETRKNLLCVGVRVEYV